MNKSLKYGLILFVILIVIGSVAGYLMWHKPRRNIAAEKGIEITAAQLVKNYQSNEDSANKAYLNKAIQVTGTVSEVKANQDGMPTVMLSSDDPFTGVYCTLKSKDASATVGRQVTIKGICSGMLTDVRLRDGLFIVPEP